MLTPTTTIDEKATTSVVALCTMAVADVDSETVQWYSTRVQAFIPYTKLVCNITTQPNVVG